jgi:hypothetical protein
MVVVPDYRDGFKDIPKNYVQKETQQSGLGYMTLKCYVISTLLVVVQLLQSSQPAELSLFLTYIPNARTDATIVYQQRAQCRHIHA